MAKGGEGRGFGMRVIELAIKSGQLTTEMTLTWRTHQRFGENDIWAVSHEPCFNAYFRMFIHIMVHHIKVKTNISTLDYESWKRS